MIEHDNLVRLADALEQQPAVMARFAPGATQDTLAALQAGVGLALPGEMLALHAFRDGTLLQPEGTILGYPLLDCRRIVAVKAHWDELATTYEGMAGDERAHHAHHGLWRRAWVPLQESDHEVVALATEPCFDGPAGQVVRFDFKGGGGWTVDHASYGDWLRTLAEVIAAGRSDACRGDAAVESIWRRVNPGVRSIEQERPALSAEARAAEDAAAARSVAEDVAAARARLSLEPGDPVRVVSGPFAGRATFVGWVEGTTRLTVEVSVFGRRATVAVESRDVEETA